MTYAAPLKTAAWVNPKAALKKVNPKTMYSTVQMMERNMLTQWEEFSVLKALE